MVLLLLTDSTRHIAIERLGCFKVVSNIGPGRQLHFELRRSTGDSGPAQGAGALPRRRGTKLTFRESKPAACFLFFVIAVFRKTWLTRRMAAVKCRNLGRAPCDPH
jgi:hypothetical protein